MTTPVTGLGFSAAATASTTPSAAAGSTGSSTGSPAGGSASGLGIDPQAFLKLLVAQLQYQDPTSPVDTSSFMNQTATLSQVQTMTSMSSTLTALAQSQQAQSATSMIGKQVTYQDAGGTGTGIVTSVSLLPSGATLQVGSATVPLSGVTTVSEPPA